MSESEFLGQVVALARLCGWLVYHALPGRTARGWRSGTQGDPGFPDVLAVHARRGLAVACELKVGRKKPTPGQTQWVLALRAAGVQAHVFTEKDWPAIEALLKGEDTP